MPLYSAGLCEALITAPPSTVTVPAGALPTASHWRRAL